LNKIVSSEDSKLKIDISNQKSGLYIVLAKDQKGVQVFREEVSIIK